MSVLSAFMSALSSKLKQLIQNSIIKNLIFSRFRPNKPCELFR